MTGTPVTATRRLIGGSVLVASMAVTAACGGGDAAEADADPTPKATVEATEASLTDFAHAYIGALNDGDRKAADAMACDGESTIYTTYADLGSKWAVSTVHFGEERSSIEFDVAGAPSTTPDQVAVLGFTALFADGAWCAEQ